MGTGEAGEGTRNAPTAMTMEMAMEMGTAVTPTTVDTACTVAIEPMVRNEYGMRSRRTKALASAVGPGDRRSGMERMAQQQARELAQLHRFIAMMANMLEMQTALQAAQGRGIKIWLEEQEEKQDTYHQDDVLRGKVITDIVATVMAAIEMFQKEERQVDTEGVSLDTSIHADLTQTGGLKKLEERQQPQLGRQLQL